MGATNSTILIVDDDAALRSSSAKWLEHHGYRTLQAGDGEAGLELYRSWKPDVLLLDLNMPQRDGLSILDVVVRESPETPVVIVSATNRVQDVIQSLRRGAWDFVSKPIDDYEVLNKVVSKVLRRAKMMRESKRYHEGLEEEVHRRTAELENEIMERRRVEMELKTAKDAAESANKSKSQFLNNMSHELRTPLTGIMGLTQLLLESGVNGEQGRILNLVLGSAEDLLGMVTELLDLSNLESGKMELAHAPFSLRQSLEPVFRSYERRCQEKGLAFEYSVAPDLEDQLVGDAVHFAHMLVNLLSNALKFTEEGKIGVRIENKHKGSPQFGHSGFLDVQVSVHDTGIGIPEKLQSSIFDNFIVGEESLTKKHGGVGLGLAICKQLANMMGGDIEVESTIGKGSRFSFFARLQRQKSKPKPAPVVETASRALITGLRPLSVLLMEKEPISRVYIRRLLQQQGHKVSVADSRERCRELLDERSFDMLLVDIHSDQLDSIDFTAEIRADRMPGVNPDIPIIAIAKNVSTDKIDRALKVGMNGFVSKPVDAEQLCSAMSQI